MRRERSWRVGLAAGLVVMAGSVDLASAAVLYGDRAAFEAALSGQTIVVEDFDDVQVNGSGFAAVGNGASFDGFSITSTSVPSDIDLTNGTPPADTGLDGTFLLRSDGSDVLVLPGGGGSSNPGQPSDDDDFRIDLDVPTEAAGLGLIENNVGPAAGDGVEWVRFRGPGGELIAEATLPVSATLERRFVGVIVEAGDPFVARIEVNEGNVLDDDIAFDDVEFTVAAPPVPSLGPLARFGLLLPAMIGLTASDLRRRGLARSVG